MEYDSPALAVTEVRILSQTLLARVVLGKGSRAFGLANCRELRVLALRVLVL